MTRPGHSPIDDDTERRVARLVQLHVETHPSRIAEATGLTPGYVRKLWMRLGITEMASVGDVLTLNAPTFPVYSQACLPAVYENARRALAECSQIDECQDWADKAAALASYARQAKDTTLQQLALRIQARAVRRAGELLKQIAPARGYENGTVVTRSQAADEAGLSERQRKTALRVASIPEHEFVEAIGRPEPLSVSLLAIRGTVSTNKPKPSVAVQALKTWARFCHANNPIEFAHTCSGLEADAIRHAVSVIDSWLDRIVTHLPVEAEVA